MTSNLKSNEPTELPISLGYGPNTGLFKMTQFNGNQATYDAWKTRMEIQIKVLGLSKLIKKVEMIDEINGFDELDEKFYDLMVCSVSDSVLGTLKSCGKSGSAMIQVFGTGPAFVISVKGERNSDDVIALI